MPQITNFDHFVELARRADKENPRPEDLQALKDALKEDPGLVRIAGNLAFQCRLTIIEKSRMTPGVKEIVSVGMTRMSQELGYETSSALEKLLIEQILLCYLRLYLWEFQYHLRAGDAEMTLAQGREWEDLIASGQRRFLRAIETLSRVRKLGVHIQFILATNGGQQVNVANLETNPNLSTKENHS